MPIPCHHTEDHNHPYAYTVLPHKQPVIHMPIQYHLTNDDNHPYAYTVPLHTKHHNHPHTYTVLPLKRPQSSTCLYSTANHSLSQNIFILCHVSWSTANQNCCYGIEIALVSFNHSCYWITWLAVGLCGWLTQRSAASWKDLALSDAGNQAPVTVRYCVLLPGEHFRCCPWPRQTVASLALNVSVLVNSQLVLMYHYLANYCHQWNST
jgi:hypothetical protein